MAPETLKQPTPYAEVNVVLNELLAAVKTVVAQRFIGLYLYGSLASGDFNPQTSDIDFVVVTAGELPNEVVDSLAIMHARLWASGLAWAAKLEGSYISRQALRRYKPADIPRPTVNEGGFYLAPHGFDWVIQRYIVREQGIVVAGPPPQSLIDPVHPDELRQAVVAILHQWWAPLIVDPARLQSDEYQAYAALSMCRALHAMQHGIIVSKPIAARWASKKLPERWSRLIEQAISWQPGTSLDELSECIDFIAYTIEVVDLFASL